MQEAEPGSRLAASSSLYLPSLYPAQTPTRPKAGECTPHRADSGDHPHIQHQGSSLPGPDHVPWPWPTQAYSLPRWVNSLPSLHEPQALKSSVIIHCEINPGSESLQAPLPSCPPAACLPQPPPSSLVCRPLLMPAYGESHNEVQTSTGLRRPHYPGGKKCGRKREEGEGAEIDGFQEYGRKAGLCCTRAPCVARATEIEPLVQASRSGPRGASPPECLPLSAGAREMVRARLCSSSCHLRPRGKNVRGENRQSMDAHCASGIASGTFSILYSHPTPTTCAHVHACTRTHTHTDTDTYEVGISLVVFLVEEMEP